ncbi:YjcZ family sporulation protein [Anaerobacillus sp. CMMVII]|nr:YjcZ family sporulation protein [Anaerobacillus sp. CMMVII]MCT8136963.1 YjcZ family sporulation protein [Anaerobacillus sp. CMMVII]
MSYAQHGRTDFTLILVLFILLVIIGAAWYY